MSERSGGFTLRDAQDEAGALGRMDFSTFALSLAASALVHLGRAPDPEKAGGAGDPPSAADLALARQTIETLQMLQEKTRGNLDDDETKLMQSVLYELRMAFVKAKDASPDAGSAP